MCKKKSMMLMGRMKSKSSAVGKLNIPTYLLLLAGSLSMAAPLKPMLRGQKLQLCWWLVVSNVLAPITLDFPNFGHKVYLPIIPMAQKANQFPWIHFKMPSLTVLDTCFSLVQKMFLTSWMVSPFVAFDAGWLVTVGVYCLRGITSTISSLLTGPLSCFCRVGPF